MIEYKEDYYRILGVAFNATQDDIKSSYRELVKKTHPDCGGSETVFVRVQQAYKTLSNEETRADYDRWYIDTYIASKKKEDEAIRSVRVYIYSPASGQICSEICQIDTKKYPMNQYAQEGAYYGIEGVRDNKNVLVLFPKDEWEQKIEYLKGQRNKKMMCKFAPLLIGIIVVVLICILFNSDADKSISSSTTIDPYPSYEEDSYYGENSYYEEEGTYEEDVLANYIEMPKPAHGATLYNYRDGYDMSIFEINLSKHDTDSYYYIKLVDPTTEKVVQAVFMDPGTTVEIVVPCGEFKLKYACGETWYGYDDVFGPYGGYSKSDEILEFTPEYGHTVTLYPVVNGNFDTEDIDFEDF